VTAGGTGAAGGTTPGAGGWGRAASSSCGGASAGPAASGSGSAGGASAMRQEMPNSPTRRSESVSRLTVGGATSDSPAVRAWASR
jgi:hypothetical protein